MYGYYPCTYKYYITLVVCVVVVNLVMTKWQLFVAMRLVPPSSSIVQRESVQGGSLRRAEGYLLLISNVSSISM